jgi:hypothetical protein
MSLRTSTRAVTLTASVALLAIVAGCSAAPAGTETEEVTGKTSEAMATRGQTQEIWAETYDGSPAACLAGETEVAIPSLIAGYGCTYGAESVGADPNQRVYAWACPVAIAEANVVPAGGLGMAAPSGWGPYSESATIVYVPSTGQACFGNADFPTEVLVVDTLTLANIGGGCHAASCGGLI